MISNVSSINFPNLKEICCMTFTGNSIQTLSFSSITSVDDVVVTDNANLIEVDIPYLINTSFITIYHVEFIFIMLYSDVIFIDSDIILLKY